VSGYADKSSSLDRGTRVKPPNYAAFLVPLLAAVTVTVRAEDPPEIPADYEWYTFEEGDTACPHPRGWFVKTESRGDTSAMFFSKENIDEQGEFKTGLTLNVVRGIKAKTGQPPSGYARAILDALVAQFPDAERVENSEQHGMPGIGLKYVDDRRQPTIVVYNFFLADDGNDVLRFFILESPQTEWTQTWQVGKTMLQCRIRR
jgi:hypothetical protein